MTERIKLPLMMFGKHKGAHHEPGKIIRKKEVVGKKLNRAGKHVDAHEWIDGTKVSTGFYPSENIIFVNIHRGGRGTGQRALSSIAQRKLDEWSMMLSDWAKRNGWETREEKIIVNLYYYFPDKRIRDTHNAKKLLMDAMQGPIVANDYFVLDRTIDFQIDPEEPRIEVEIIDYVG